MQTEEVIKRIEQILEYFGLTASSFADKINVQRSSISHLLSGRNKPSLDFILKIIEHFSEVDIMWLLKGEGVFPKINSEIVVTKTFPTPISDTNKISNQKDLFTTEEIISKNDLFENILEVKPTLPKNDKNEKVKEIEQIVIFYKDGSFNLYK